MATAHDSDAVKLDLAWDRLQNGRHRMREATDKLEGFRATAHALARDAFGISLEMDTAVREIEATIKDIRDLSIFRGDSVLSTESPKKGGA